MAQENIRSLSSLIASINQTATQRSIDAVSDAIRQAIRDEVDPYVLCGVLVEGIAMAVMGRIPAQKRDQIAADVLKLLCVRFQTLGLLSKPRSALS